MLAAHPNIAAAATFYVLYVLGIEQFESIREDDPVLGQKLLTYFVSIMAERLTFANRMIAVLRR